MELKGRLGEEPQDAKEMKILNRIVRIAPDGLLYVADQMHVERLAKGLGLEKDPSGQDLGGGRSLRHHPWP